MPDYFYYTYGGFDTIANALRSVSLIFGNSSFQGIFFTAMVLGLALGIMAFYIRALSGAQLSPLSLVVTFAISISLYMGLFVPKCRVHVEDKTTGQFQVISGIPLGMGATLGVLNKIEVGINEEIIQPTFGVFYRDSAGGRGIEAILYLLTSGFATSTKNPALEQTIQRYFNDCVVFEAGRPNGSISVHGIMNGSISLETAFANSASPAVWTIDYIPPASNAGDTKTCNDVWSVLNNKLSDTSFIRESFLNPTCAAAGFDISSAYYWSCVRVLSGHLAWLASAPGTKYDSSSLTLDINTFARRTYLASMIAQVVERNGIVPFANIQMLKHSTSTALVLNSWLPYIKAATTSIFILIAPFILIFLPTPLFGRALSLVVGLFIWLTVWSIVDALAHNSLTFYISSAFEKFRESFANLPSYQYGLTAIYKMGDPLYKSLAFLGYVRGAGVVLASAIAYGLFRFGGYAFTQFASGLQEMTARAGHKAADQVMNPAGARSTQNANLESSAYWGTAFEQRRAAAQGHVGWGIASGMAQEQAIRNFGFSGVQQSMFYDTARNISANQKVITGLGGGNPLVAADMVSSVSAGELIGKVNEFTKQARARGITTLEMGAQFSAFQTQTGLAKMDATMGFADYLVQTGQAKNYYDAYRKMDEFGLLGRAVGAADAYGGDRNRFLKDISTLTAAKMGDINALRLVALATRGSASDENVQWVRENISRPELLNELAKFQVRSKFAQALGIMKNDQDDQGFYEYLKLSQGIDKLTLNKDMANRLNEIMHNAGYTNFNAKEGDIATIAFTPDGMPHYAITGRGGKSETFDVDKAQIGKDYATLNRDSFDGVVSIGTLEKMASDPNLSQALRKTLGKAVNFMKSKGLTAAHMNMVKNPNGGPNSVGFLSISAGGTALVSNHALDKNGWRSMDEAVRSGEYGSYSVYHHGEQKHLYGVQYDFGNDTLSMFIDGKPSILAKNYSEFFRGNEPTKGGRAFVDHVVKQMGGYGKLAQSVQDELKASIAAGIDLRKTYWGKVLGIGAEMGIEAQRAAVESINADTMAIATQNYYSNIMRQNKSESWKMRQFAGFTQDMYALINKHATMPTAEQMIETGADNPAKGQGVRGMNDPKTGSWDNKKGKVFESD